MKKILLFSIMFLTINVYAINASSYIVMDTDTNRILEGSNIHKKSLIASTTKIMTSMVVINNINLDKKITVSNNVLKSYGSGIYVSVGEEITIRDLLYGLMLRSGNDAATELSYQTAGSMEGFVYLMNETAKSIGMENTSFVNSTGLEDGNNANISTVYDMGLLSSYAINNEIYRKIVGTNKYVLKTNLKSYIWYNKNKLLSTYKYTTGGKTGYTKKAKRTLVTNASKDNINLTIVTFNDKNDFNDHKSLYEKYFKTLKKYKILKKGKYPSNIENTYIEKDYYMALNNKELNKIEKEINYINKGNKAGEVIIKLNGIEYYKTDLIKKEKKQSIYKKIINKIKAILW